MLMFLPSTLDRKEDMLQYRNSVNLHAIDVSYADLKEFNDGDYFNPSHLDSRHLRQGLTKFFYSYMKKVAETSNHNLVRNSDAYMANGGKIDTKDPFSWINSAHVETQQKFELGY